MLRRFGPTQTSVVCPRCQRGTLAVRRFCLRTALECDDCDHPFTLAELAGLLEEEPFAELAEAVGDRLSDRL
jgi:hypothetical protein